MRIRFHVRQKKAVSVETNISHWVLLSAIIAIFLSVLNFLQFNEGIEFMSFHRPTVTIFLSIILAFFIADVPGGASWRRWK